GIEHVDLEPNQLRGEAGQSIGLPARSPVFDRERLDLDIAELTERFSESLDRSIGKIDTGDLQYADYGDFPRLLRLSGLRRNEEARGNGAHGAPPVQHWAR